MRIITILLALVLFSGCATINSISEWQRHNFEKGAYSDTLDVYSSAVPEKLLNECGYLFNAPIPPTMPLTAEELAEKAREPVKGLYYPATKEVFYLHGEFYSLSHEYFHYMDDIANVDEYCLRQVIAYFGVKVIKQKEAIKKWKRVNKKLQRRLRNRR